MSKLEAFLALGNAEDLQDTVSLKRVGVDVVVKAMNSNQFGEYKRRSMGKIGKEGLSFDSSKFNLLICAGQIIDPDFSNAEFLNKAGCLTAIDFISKKFLPGEIEDVASACLALSGYDTDQSDAVDEAKN